MKFKINNRSIGKQEPVFIIAELSANHNHDLQIAKDTIIAAKESGADAIKLQTYTPDTMTIDCDNKYFQINQGTLWDGKTLYELYKEAYTPWDWHEELFLFAKENNLICFSTPFDIAAVDFLEQFNPPVYKIASFEISDVSLIRYVASKGKPIIISTGIATLSEIYEAVNACREEGNNHVALLKCTSAYPAPYEEINLKTINNLKEVFQVIPGLSDHTIGINIPIAAVALGAKIIEKHFILKRDLGGPDADFSIEPNEFKEMVNSIRNVEKAIGEISYEISEKVENNRIFARSLFVVKDIKAGDIFTEENIRSIRPGYGLPPKYLKVIIGKKAKIDIKRGIPLSWDIII